MSAAAKLIFIFSILIPCLGVSATLSRSLSSIPDREKSLDLTKIEAVYPHSDNLLSKENLQKYFPKELRGTNNEGEVVGQFAKGLDQKLLDTFVNGDFFRKSNIGKLTSQIEEVTRASVPVATTTAGVQHRVNFDLKAFEKKAVVSYDGFVDSDLVYTADDNTLRATLRKPLSGETTVSLVHANSIGQAHMESVVQVTYQF